MARLATTDEAIALKAKIMPSSVASAVNALAFNIHVAPSINLISDSGRSSSIFLLQMIEALDTMEALAHALIARAIASWE